ncbi:DUF3761 domain-containing protein [Kitasatospora azatica]|uniref:DUF3761 domain-containing protein n=1 Tax=Kitasatospora azatica TaxID=58347 RepID=UPI001E525B4B|nr:DUF3761 domain-containing protein [Kitasatospora azatica]
MPPGASPDPNSSSAGGSSGGGSSSSGGSSGGVPNPGAGATALCNDGTYSFSAHHQGTCSSHGGVAVWYK